MRSTDARNSVKVDYEVSGPGAECDVCEDVIGMYEPVVAFTDGYARHTSLVVEPMVEARSDVVVQPVRVRGPQRLT